MKGGITVATILLTKSSLTDISSQLKRMQSETEEARKKVNSAIIGLDFEVASKQNIKTKMNKLNSTLSQQVSLSEQYKSAFVNVFNSYNETDEKFGNESKGIFDKIKDCVTENIGNVKDFFLKNKLLKFAQVSALFLPGGSLVNVFNSWDNAKDYKKIASVVKKITTAFNNGELPEWLEDVVDNEGLDIISGIYDIEKLITASLENDFEEIADLIGKYGIVDPLKEIFKLSGETSAGAGVLAELLFEDGKSLVKNSYEFANEAMEILTSKDSDWKDYAKLISTLQRMPDKVIWDGFSSVVGNTADSIGGVLEIFGLTEVPEQGYLQFYKDSYNDVVNMYNTFGFKDTISIYSEAITDTIKEQYTSIIDCASSLGEKFKGFIDRI